MFIDFVFSGLPQEPSGRWSASRYFTPRSIAAVTSSGFGGVIRAGFGPSVACGERCTASVVRSVASLVAVASAATTAGESADVPIRHIVRIQALTETLTP